MAAGHQQVLVELAKVAAVDGRRVREHVHDVPVRVEYHSAGGGGGVSDDAGRGDNNETSSYAVQSLEVDTIWVGLRVFQATR